MNPARKSQRWNPRAFGVALLLLAFSHLTLSLLAPRHARADILFTAVEPVAADPGSFATISCRIEYNDERTKPWREMRVRFTPPLEWHALTSERTVSMRPGKTQTIPFTVRVPEQARPDRAYDAAFQLSFPTDGGSALVALRSITVKERHGLRIESGSTDLTARAGERVELSLAVYNDGNSKDEIRFAYESVPNWRVGLEPPELVLEPGASHSVVVTIEVPEGTSGGTLHLLDLRAESMGPVTAFARVRTEVLKEKVSTSRYGHLPIAIALTAGEIAPGEHTYGVRVLASGGVGSNADLSLEADLTSRSPARGADRWQSETLRARVSRGAWELSAGDLGVPLSSLSAPSFSGRGVRVTGSVDPWKLSLLGVRNREDERTASWSAGLERRIVGGLHVGGELLKRETSRGIEGIREDRVQTVQTTWRGPHRLLLRGELAASQSIANDDPARSQQSTGDGKTHGRAAQITVEKSGRIATVRSRFYSGSPGFGGRIGDRDGALVFTSWAPGGRFVRLWSSVEDQDGRSPGDSTRSELTRMRGGVRLEPRRWPGLEVSAGDLDEREHLPDSLQVTEHRDLIVTTKMTRGPLLTVASIQHGIVRDRTNGAEGRTRSLELSAGGRIRDARLALRWSRSEDWSPIDRNAVESDAWTTDLAYAARSGKANVGLSVGQRTIASSTASGSRVRQLVLEPRLGFRVFRGWTMRVDASVNRFDGETQVDRWQVSLNHSAIDLLPIPWVPLRGGIHGVVFVDLNGDGQPGIAEPRIENVLVRVDGRYQPSDRHGEFSWPNLEPGTYWVEIDRGSVPPEHQLPADLPLEVTIEAGHDRDIWIALSPCGSVSGRVFLDDDRDGRFGEREHGLAGLRIALWRDGSAVAEVMTDTRGRFHVVKVPAGSYELRVEQQWVPTSRTPAGSGSTPIPTAPNSTTDLAMNSTSNSTRSSTPNSTTIVNVEPGVHTELNDCGVAPKKKPVVITYQGR